MRLRPLQSTTALLALALLAPSVVAWSCAEVPTDKGTLDLSGLKGVKVATRETETPPTKNTARVRLDICDVLPKEDGVKDEDQVGVASQRGAAASSVCLCRYRRLSEDKWSERRLRSAEGRGLELGGEDGGCTTHPLGLDPLGSKSSRAASSRLHF